MRLKVKTRFSFAYMRRYAYWYSYVGRELSPIVVSNLYSFVLCLCIMRAFQVPWLNLNWAWRATCYKKINLLVDILHAIMRVIWIIGDNTLLQFNLLLLNIHSIKDNIYSGNILIIVFSFHNLVNKVKLINIICK